MGGAERRTCVTPHGTLSLESGETGETSLASPPPFPPRYNVGRRPVQCGWRAPRRNLIPHGLLSRADGARRPTEVSAHCATTTRLTGLRNIGLGGDWGGIGGGRGGATACNHYESPFSTLAAGAMNAIVAHTGLRTFHLPPEPRRRRPPPPATGPAVPEMTPVLLFPHIHM